ncbi:MAG TPA: hypothetical protein VMD47_09975 [Candidatus Acidoferrales bacterium]|nr:hypothetical protein [Candidatus Acidoferrales bacterium]
MPVSADVQSAITQRYAELGDAVTHDPTQERDVLAPEFKDRARMKLATFEYDPLTVVVQKIVVKGNGLEVHAEYVGVHGHNVNTVDHWVKRDGQWYLVDRT